MTSGSCGHLGEAGVPLLPQWERPFDPCKFDRYNYLPKHFMKSTVVPYKMFSTSFAFISYVPIGPADPWDSIHFRPDPWDHGPMSGLFLHRLLLRYCYTPTLVWDVTNEKRLNPPYWVGGWAAPKVGRLSKKMSKTSLRMPSCHLPSAAFPRGWPNRPPLAIGAYWAP